jgi:hypothetical protein
MSFANYAMPPSTLLEGKKKRSTYINIPQYHGLDSHPLALPPSFNQRTFQAEDYGLFPLPIPFNFFKGPLLK